MDAAHGFGERRRDGKHDQLAAALSSLNRNGVRADDLQDIVLALEAIERSAGEEAVRAGDADRPGAPPPEVAEQLDDRAALGDLVVDDDRVLARYVADDGADLDPVVFEALLRAHCDADAEKAGEGGGVLGIAEVRRDDDGVGEVVAPEMCGDLAQGI